MWPFKKKQKLPLYYSEKETSLIENYINLMFGESTEVMHEIFSPDIHVDIALVPPADGRNYYTLVTMGMGAYQMKVPDFLAKEKFNRAELIIRLPEDWDIKSADAKWYWPIYALKSIARIPVNQNCFLTFGHTFDFGNPFAENVKFSAVGLDFAFDDVRPCPLPNGDNVVFYNVIPIYKEEMAFRFEHSANDFLDIFTDEDLHGALNINRKNRCK